MWKREIFSLMDMAAHRSARWRPTWHTPAATLSPPSQWPAFHPLWWRVTSPTLFRHLPSTLRHCRPRPGEYVSHHHVYLRPSVWNCLLEYARHQLILEGPPDFRVPIWDYVQDLSLRGPWRQAHSCAGHPHHTGPPCTPFRSTFCARSDASVAHTTTTTSVRAAAPTQSPDPLHSSPSASSAPDRGCHGTTPATQATTIASTQGQGRIQPGYVNSIGQRLSAFELQSTSHAASLPMPVPPSHVLYPHDPAPYTAAPVACSAIRCPAAAPPGTCGPVPHPSPPSTAKLLTTLHQIATEVRQQLCHLSIDSSSDSEEDTRSKTRKSWWLKSGRVRTTHDYVVKEMPWPHISIF